MPICVCVCVHVHAPFSIEGKRASVLAHRIPYRRCASTDYLIRLHPLCVCVCVPRTSIKCITCVCIVPTRPLHTQQLDRN